MPTVFFTCAFVVGYGLAEVACAFGAPLPQALSALGLLWVVMGASDDPPSFFLIHSADPTTERMKETSGSRSREDDGPDLAEERRFPVEGVL